MRRGERGAALAEMVVVAPLLLIVLIGAVEAGRFGNFAILVAGGARAGVQYGAQSLVTALDTDGMETAATTDAQNPNVTAVGSSFCKCSDGTADANCLPATCSSSHQIVYVQVVTTGRMTSLFNYAPLPATLRNITVTSTAVMRVAQ